MPYQPTHHPAGIVWQISLHDAGLLRKKSLPGRAAGRGHVSKKYVVPRICFKQGQNQRLCGSRFPN